ncbi:MAG: flagellar hook-associated protein FlgK, partial [Mariprofundaceae bacterium]
MIFDSLNVAASSLKAQQKSMDVVSHNIANVNTPGYSRQSADLATAVPDKIGNLNFGRGVDLQNIHRSVDPLIGQAQLVNGAQQGYWSEISAGLGTVENVFGSLQSTGLASSLDEFFLSWQQLANNPQDAAQKLNVRTKSATVTTNLNSMQQQLASAQLSADNKIDQGILQANQLLDQIASLTAQISRQENGSQGVLGAANDLRDQRDQAVRDLSQFIPVQQISTRSGSFLIQTMSGDLLSQDNTARHLARGAAGAGGFSEISIAETGQPVGGLTSGGSIGGLVDLRDNKFGGYLGSIDSIAANLAFSVNQLQASGASSTPVSSQLSGQISNPAVALDSPTQITPFAAQIQSGSFTLHVYDAAGAPTPAGGTAINITAGVTTMNDIAAQINAVAGVSASVDGSGRLSVNAGSGSMAFSGDSSNFLAAYEVNSFFHGGDAASISLSDQVRANAGSISTGRVDPLTSIVQSGDNAVALDMLALQNTALNIDGSGAASLHDRTTSLSTQYGNDVSAANQQKQYRSAEADSLNAQRQAISGVNIDEELISMIKFQRAYEASAKVISTTN